MRPTYIKMLAYTTIRTENDAIHFQAQLKADGTYECPSLSFYAISEPLIRGWRNSDDQLEEIWDNPIFLIDDLYLNVVKHCKMGMNSGDFDPELKELLSKSMCSLEELKDVMTLAIRLGFFKNVDCEFFS